MRLGLLFLHGLALGCGGDASVVVTVADPKRLAEGTTAIFVGSGVELEERSMAGRTFPVTMLLRGEPDTAGPLEVIASLDGRALARGRGQIYFDPSIILNLSIDLDRTCTADRDCDDGFCNGPDTCDSGICISGPTPCPISDCISCDDDRQSCVVVLRPGC
jgi:hypothetical protein